MSWARTASFLRVYDGMSIREAIALEKRLLALEIEADAEVSNGVGKFHASDLLDREAQTRGAP
jgi:hypothetical protein